MPTPDSTRTAATTTGKAGLVEPHIVLADLIKILHPDRLTDHALKFYKKLD